MTVTINTSGGIIQSVGVRTNDIRAQLSANVTNGITYDNATGIIDQTLNTSQIGEGVNLYYTNARFDTRLATKDTDDLSEGTTNLYLNGAGTTANLAEGSNLYFTDARAVSAITDATIAPGNVTLKEFKETIVDNGAATSGALTLDMSAGSLHLVAINGDITGITLSNMDEGATATIVFEQDVFGGRTINTASGFTAWNFMGGVTDLGPVGATRSVLVVTLADGVYQASISSPDAATTDDLAEGTTNKYYTNNRSRGAISTTTATPSGSGALVYNNNTGVFTFTPADSPLSNAQVQAYIETNGLDVSANIILNGTQDDNGGQIIFSRDAWGTGYDHAHISKTGTNNDLKITSQAGYNLILDDTATSPTASRSFKIDRYGFGSINPLFEVQPTGNVKIDLNPTGPLTSTAKFTIGHYLHGGSASTNEIFEVDMSGNIDALGVIGGTVSFTAPISGNVAIAGNLQVSGNIDYVNAEDLLVKDQSISLNVGNVAQDAMIIVDRAGSGAGANTEVRWNETTDRWTFTNDGSTYNNILTTADLPADAVTSVNTFTGAVSLDTDNIPEGTAKYYATSLFNTDFATKTTTDLTEGTNLYYTQSRFDTRLATKSTSDLTEGTNLYYTDTRSRAAVSLAAPASASSGGALAYNSTTGAFTFTPADTQTDSEVRALLSVTQASASGTGALAYNNGTGVFTYTPPALPTGDITDVVAGVGLSGGGASGAVTLTLDPTITTGTASGGGALAYNNATGVFTFTPADTSLATKSTTDLVEGTNLYYTDARADARVNLQTGVNLDLSKSTTDLAEGTNLYYTDARSNTSLATKSTTDLAEGTNLYYTDARVETKIDSYVVGSENITVTSGAIATKPALGSTNSITTEASSGFTLDSNDGIVFKQQFIGVPTPVVSITGDGYALFGGNEYTNTARVTYTGTTDLSYRFRYSYNEQTCSCYSDIWHNYSG